MWQIIAESNCNPDTEGLMIGDRCTGMEQRARHVLAMGLNSARMKHILLTSLLLLDIIRIVCSKLHSDKKFHDESYHCRLFGNSVSAVVADEISKLKHPCG